MIVILVVVALSLVPAVVLGEDPRPPVAPDRFFYSNAEMTGFDLENHLASEAPHLLPYREVISHWCGYTTVSPRVALALVEHETGLVTDPTPDGRFDRPLGDLAPVDGFSRQLEVILGTLAHEAYRLRSPRVVPEPALRRFGPSWALAALLAPSSGEDAIDLEIVDGLTAVYGELFPDQPPLSEPRGPEVVPRTVPEAFLMLPFPLGDVWSFNGTHTWDGSDPGAMSAMDFSRDWPAWGADTSDDVVVASHPGEVKIHSSCSVVVMGPGGWSTSYYHLDDIMVSDGQQVTRNQPLAVYASSQGQALCSGGHSSGPHVHFALLHDGRYHALDGSELSGWRVHEGRFSYDSACAHFWIEQGTEKRCAYSTVRNEGFQRTLDVIRSGASGGLVTSSPPGIDCGADCRQSFLQGTEVTLFADPGPTATFTGWSGGGCSGVGPCTVRLESSKTVTAAYAEGGVSLEVEPAGDGEGVVTTEPTGIDCGDVCQRSFAEGSTVTLTAVAGPFSTFAGWSGGGCSGLAPCTIEMLEARSVTALFEPSDTGPWLSSPSLPGFRVKTEISAAGTTIDGSAVDDCIAETLCVAGALPDRAELFVRVVGPKPNGFLWPTLVKFSTSRADVWIEQSATGKVQRYLLPAVTPGEQLLTLDGLAHKLGFEPVESDSPEASSRTPSLFPRNDPAPPSGDWLESPDLPGFRVKVRISAGDTDRAGTPVEDCIGETLCVAGALPDRAEIFVRVVGPKPNGYHWPTLVKFSTSRIEVWLEQTASGETRYYDLPAVAPGEEILTLDGLADKLGFEP